MTRHIRHRWTGQNLHLTDVTGNPNRTMTGAVWAERFSNMTRGHFLVGRVSITWTKFIGYRLLLKDATTGEHLLDVIEKNCIGFDRCLDLVADWMNQDPSRFPNQDEEA